MNATDFDANERICGFSLPSIKRALTLVGFPSDRDDVKHVAKSLECSTSQAKRVLEELESRGFVEKTGRGNHWETTPLGAKLVFHWQPPRRFEPAIDLEDGRILGGEGMESVPCSIRRSTPDDDEMFEEAQFEVGVTYCYTSDRVIELNVLQPDDYEDPDGGGIIDFTALLSLSDATKIRDGLDKAIEAGKRELERRKAKKVRRRARPKKAGATGAAKKKKGSGKAPKVRWSTSDG